MPDSVKNRLKANMMSRRKKEIRQKAEDIGSSLRLEGISHRMKDGGRGEGRRKMKVDECRQRAYFVIVFIITELIEKDEKMCFCERCS